MVDDTEEEAERKRQEAKKRLNRLDELEAELIKKGYRRVDKMEDFFPEKEKHIAEEETRIQKEVERAHDEANAMKAKEKEEVDQAHDEANAMIAQEKYDKSLRGRAGKLWSKTGDRGRATAAATAGLAAGAVGAASRMSGGSLFILFAILLNLFDNKLFRFSFLGSVWNGFQLSSFANVDYLGLLTAPLVMGLILFYYFTKRGGRSLFVSFFVVFLITYIGTYVQNPFLSLIPFDSLYIYIGLAVVVVFFAFLKVLKDKEVLETDEITIIILAYVIGFFFLNRGWMVYWRAQFHFWFIIAFGLFYIRQNEQANGEAWKWHIWVIGLLLTDFFVTAYIETFPFFQYLPFLTAVVCLYVKQAEPDNKFALWILLAALMLLIANQASASGYLGSYDFLQAGKVVDDSKSVFARSYETIKLAIERQIEFATGGLYRSQVELNQYAPLGVFFERVRAAQPRFYDDEPVTLWATISARTLGDPVVVNFDCSRWNGNTRVNLQSDDKLTPPYPFTVGTYEEKDVECTFSDKKLPAGLNTISLSATYNFDTSAYQKLYFMDKERLRAMRRENLDPLKEYGITDLSIDATEDQGPATIYTNGPVELAVRAGNKLIAVSNDKDIYPVLEILLQNRNKITDKNGNPVGEWQGKIKKVNELVVVLPAGTKLLTADCNPVPFEPIDDVNKYCTDSCTEVCNNSCEEYNYDAVEKQKCLDACPNPLKSDTRKKCDSQCLDLFRGDTTKEKYHGYKLDIKKLNELDANSGYRDIDRFKTFQCRITADQSVLDNVPITTKYIRLKARYDYLLEKSYDVTVEKAPIESVPVSSQKAIDSAVGKIEDGYVQLEEVPFSYNLLNALIYLESRGRHCCQESGKNSAKTCKASDDLSCPADRVLTSFDGSSIGIMQINTKCENKKCPTCETCAQRNRRMEQKVCAPDQNIYNRACNIKVGLEILKEAYRNYGNGIKEDTLKNYCSPSSVFDGRNLYNLYKSYRGFDAVLRAYNGWGCNVDKLKIKCTNYCGSKETCIKNCISGTVFYVDKVNEIAKQMQSGLLPAPLAIDELPTMEEFEESATT